MSLVNPLKRGTQDLGPLLRLLCPQCDSTQWFHLKRHSVSTRILLVEFSKISACSVHCVKCDFALDLSDTDAEKAIPFLAVAQTFAEGKITELIFSDKLDQAGFAFYRQYKEANTNWICMKCGEESPTTFATCWNCGEESNRPHIPASDEPQKTPYLDQVLKNKGNPLGLTNL
jgi:ribosomal protein L40E